MKGFKANIQRGKIAELQIWLIIAVNVALIALYFARVILRENFYPKGRFTGMLNTILDVIDNLSFFLDLSYSTLLIICVFTFISWFWQAYYNLNIITKSCNYKNIWAIIGWFIPVINLFVPYRIMNELYTKTDKYLLERHLLTNIRYSPTDRPNTKLVKWWWALVIVVAAALILRFSLTVINPVYLMGGSGNIAILLFNQIGYILLAFVTIIVIREYQKAEYLLFYNQEEEEETIYD